MRCVASCTMLVSGGLQKRACSGASAKLSKDGGCVCTDAMDAVQRPRGKGFSLANGSEKEDGACCRGHAPSSEADAMEGVSDVCSSGRKFVSFAGDSLCVSKASTFSSALFIAFTAGGATWNCGSRN